ncbi:MULTISPECIES: hypothetical protein [unclassified Bradyrhizobium]|nr:MULTISPECIES: hypothetical protein [unclassified Bradyrhizobium]
MLYFLLGILGVAIVVLGYNFYHAQWQTEGAKINVEPATSGRAD